MIRHDRTGLGKGQFFGANGRVYEKTGGGTPLGPQRDVVHVELSIRTIGTRRVKWRRFKLACGHVIERLFWDGARDPKRIHCRECKMADG